jgi:hypothetical protein
MLVIVVDWNLLQELSLSERSCLLMKRGDQGDIAQYIGLVWAAHASIEKVYSEQCNAYFGVPLPGSCCMHQAAIDDANYGGTIYYEGDKP